MKRIYAIGGLLGPLAYFSTLANAVAYWNYAQYGDGVNPPPCDLIGIHPEELCMTEINLFDVDNEEFMNMVHAGNEQRARKEKARQVLELQ